MRQCRCNGSAGRCRRARTSDLGHLHSPEDEIGLGHLEAALRKASEALRIEAKLRAAVRKGIIDRAPGEAMASAGLAAGVISKAELEALHAADAAREEVIQVDAFEAVEYQKLRR